MSYLLKRTSKIPLSGPTGHERTMAMSSSQWSHVNSSIRYCAWSSDKTFLSGALCKLNQCIPDISKF